MDINYLLFLQNFRTGMNDAWTPFLEWLSHFAVSGLILLPALIYWCIDKKKGFFILTATSACLVVNSVIKLTACVYRPWIRDPRITPAGDAIKEATGYSFPSGHTAAAGPMLGGTAMCFKEKKAVPPICIIILLMVAFSRNYLGVHTPQDVLVALTLSICCLYFMRKLFLRLEEHPEEEDKWLLIFFLVSAAALVYVTVKPYPMDYVDGKLLVDPKDMMRDGYKDFGQMCALCLGRYAEKHCVRFRPTGLNAKGIAVGVAGLVPIVLVRKVLDKVLVSVFGVLIGGMLGRCALVLVIILVWPVVIRMICGQEECRTQKDRLHNGDNTKQGGVDMVELSLERIDEMLHKETPKKEETTTILRCVFSRYMQLYERYLADIDALNDEMIAELKAYHEETRSLCRYYYMDIPLEICSDLYDYDEEYTKKLLGPDWKKYISDSFEEFKTENKGKIKPEEMKAEFQDQNLNAFYLSMDEIFRDDFGTGSETAKKATSWLSGLLFGKED